MSLSGDLQKLIYETLVADPDVGALVDDRIYDGMPSDGTYPCVTFGPSDDNEDDSEGITGVIETVQLDCWTESQGRLGPCKDLCSAVKSALHKRDLSLATGYLVQIRVSGRRVFRDADGLTAHGVVTVEAIMEEA